MPVRAKVGIALLFAAGIVGGFILGSGLRPAPEGSGDPLGDRAQVPAPSGPADEPAAPGKGRTAERADRSPLRSALEALPASRAATGAGRITGLVVDEEGNPLPGVQVRAVPSHIDKKVRETQIQRPDTGEGSVGEAVRAYWKLVQQRKAQTRAAATDEAGAYEIAGLTRQEYVVFALRKGKLVSPGGGTRSNTAHAGDVVNFVARSRAPLKLDVLLPDGSPPAEAKVSIVNRPFFWRVETWRPSRPVIELIRGTYEIHVTAGEVDRFSSEKQSVTVRPGPEATEAVVRLEGKSLLRGRVVVPPEAAVPVVQVLALSEAQGQPLDPETLMTKGRIIGVFRRNGYYFSLLDLPPGPCLVGAAWNLRTPAVTRTVNLGADVCTVELSLPPPEPRDSVRLRVTDPQGRILRGCSVSVLAKRAGPWGSSGAGQLFENADGTYLVVHSPRGRGSRVAENPRFIARAHSPEYGSKEREYAPRDEEEIELRFDEPARLEVTVEAYGGSSFEGRLLLTLRPKGATGRRRSALRAGGGGKLSAEGVQTFGPVSPGEYELVAYMREGRHTTWPVKKQALTLAKGENRVSLPLPRLHTLTVEMAKPVAGARLWLEPLREGGWSRSGTTDKQGRCVFEHLALGVYKLALWSGGQTGEMRVRIPFQTLVRFTPKTRSALRVKVTDPAGYLAGIGLQTGDLVTAVDGVAFKSSNHIQALMFGALAKESVKLTVQRGERTLTVRGNPKMLAADDKELGGSLTPASR